MISRSDEIMVHFFFSPGCSLSRFLTGTSKILSRMPIIHSSTPEWSAEMENRPTLKCVVLVWVLVFESPVRSGLLPPGRWTETETGPPKS
jgi:hypothetical protein